VAKSKSNEFADSPIERALAVIAPSKNQRDDCREDLELVIPEIADTVPRRSITQSRQLTAVAESFRDTRRAIEKLSLHDQILLLRKPPFQRFSRPTGPPDNMRKLLAAFFHELNQLAAWAEEWSKFHKVPPSDRPKDYQRLEAAKVAHWLLFEFSAKRPSLTPGSDFLELASTLYEAATGKVDVDLRHQCRTVIAEQRQK
jgi:hypothetical protein